MMPVTLSNITVLFTGFSLAATGAIQPGLVNITVAKTAYEGSGSNARFISLGAAFIEIVYGLMALFAGSLIKTFIANNQLNTSIIIAVLVAIGIYFILKREHSANITAQKYQSLITGIKLNLISFQMLLFWLIAVAVVTPLVKIPVTPINFISFSFGIALGKLFILELYRLIGERMFSKISFINRNTNKIIGLLFILTAIYQALTL